MQFNPIKPLLIASCLVAVVGCAAFSSSAKPVPQNNYSFDLYQYKLTTAEYALIQKAGGHEFKSESNLNIIKLEDEHYWKLVSAIESDQFFSSYNYDFNSCQQNPNKTALQDKTNSASKCNYVYTNPNINVSLILNSYLNNNLSYTLNTSNNQSGSKTSTNGNFNPEKQFLLFSLKDGESTLFFIMNNNPLHKSWAFYQKTPQYENISNPKNLN